MGAFLEIFCCLVVSFVFSGVEAGILSVNRVRLRHRAKLKDESAKMLNLLLADPERMLITVLLVTNSMQILALSLGVKLATKHLGNVGYWVVFLVALPVWVLGIELLPKSLFRRFPYRALAFLSRLLYVVDVCLRPLQHVGMRLIRLLFWNRPPTRMKLFGAREDFKQLTSELERSGDIGREERSLIHAVLDFRQLTALDVLVSLEAAGAIPGDLSLPAARARAKSLNVDRLPVLDEAGRVTGLLDLHELALEDEWHGAVEVFQRRIVRVDINEPAHAVMRKLRAARLPMAVVRRPSGESAGVVLWDDLVRLLLLPPDQASPVRS